MHYDFGWNFFWPHGIIFYNVTRVENDSADGGMEIEEDRGNSCLFIYLFIYVTKGWLTILKRKQSAAERKL